MSEDAVENEVPECDEGESRLEGGSPLSMERATEIFDALHFANLDLEARNSSLVDIIKRSVADLANLSFKDVAVSTKFRGEDRAVHIRQLFLEAVTMMGEAMPVNPGSSDADAFEECWSGVVANLAEILSRAGLATVNDSADFVEGDFVPGYLYKLKIGKRNILATCAGCAEKGEYFEMDGYPVANGTPFFEFDGTKIGDNLSRIGREYVRQDHDRDVIQQFCGYDIDGRKVVKKIREELLNTKPTAVDVAQVPAEDYKI